MSTHPEVLWAQRSSASSPEKNIVYLTVNLPDINESSLQYSLSSTGISFKASTTGGAHYAFDLDLFAEVDAEKSSKRLTSRSLAVVLRKKELNSEYWPRLTKEKIKTPFIKTDFQKWVDEDEQDGAPNLDDDMPVGGIPGMGGDFDFTKMMEQAGAGGADDFNPGGDGDPVADSDEDEDGPPPLTEPEATGSK